jgi:uncharacterized protein (TIGR02246 family)
MTVLKRRAPALLAVLAAGGLIAIALLRPFHSTAAGQKADGKPAADPSAAETEVRKASADYVAAMTAGDLDAILAFWAEDADYISEDGTVTRGKPAIAELFKSSLPWPKGTKYAGKVNSVRPLRGEIVLEDGTLTATEPDGTTGSNRYALVWTKTDGKWLMSSVRDLPSGMPDLPSAPFPQLQGLQWLVGEWEEAGAGPEITMKCRWAENKAFLLMDFTVKRAEKEPLTVSQRIGWDPLNGVVRSWVFDSEGGFGEGDWERAGRTWTVGATGVLPDGGTGAATHRYEFQDENSFVWRATNREVDSQPLDDVEVKYVRAGTKKEGGGR